MAEDMKTLTIQDVFDMDFLQGFQDNFARAVGMTAVTVDAEGKPVTRPTDWTDFCMKYTRASAEGCKRCEACDRKGGEAAARTGKPSVYECHAGLWDFGAPIIVDGQQIGSILGGQVLTGPVDEAKFREYAKEINVDPEAYVEALRKVQHVSKERLEQAAQVLYMIAGAFSRMAHYKTQLRALAEDINTATTMVSATMEELAASSHDVDTNQATLSKEIENVSHVAEKIDSFTDMIRNIAKQTRLLGLNASIEAARSGDAGAGFAVVSEEIGALADKSREAVDNINAFTSKISESVYQAIEKGRATSQIVSQQNIAINDTAEELVSLTDASSQLVEMANRS